MILVQLYAFGGRDHRTSDVDRCSVGLMSDADRHQCHRPGFDPAIIQSLLQSTKRPFAGLAKPDYQRRSKPRLIRTIGRQRKHRGQSKSRQRCRFLFESLLRFVRTTRAPSADYHPEQWIENRPRPPHPPRQNQHSGSLRTAIALLCSVRVMPHHLAVARRDRMPPRTLAYEGVLESGAARGASKDTPKDPDGALWLDTDRMETGSRREAKWIRSVRHFVD